ncbi:carboxymuconolactone decarboxylase family protein [Paraburkholderia panacisoli]|uniref:carboxymuconolactone decarboxylase family protein n=1 Tax=Paraburkholderia panacisoli TaxID=2603818 RepID=UPI00165FC17A|nr:carboxymuconolactone decarboxylase family protein [Paraburkholderia panacisoli]
MIDSQDYAPKLREAIGELGAAAPATLAGFHALDGAAARAGKLDTRTRELIALAVAVTTRCDGCIALHSAAAARAGASREEVAEALSVAIALNAGAALVYSARALDAFGQQSG